MASNPNEFYYTDKNGMLVFTEKYHLERGYCCHNGCRHCPYGSSTVPSDKPINEDKQDRGGDDPV